MANISQQKIDSAAQGNMSSLREVLNQMQQATVEQQTVTGTIPTQTVAGQPNPNAPVPPQARGTASLLSGSYIVQIVNPGATNPISSIQAAAAGQAATATTNLQAVKAIYHQIRASTTPAFNVNSNTQTFGGDTGSAQVYWTLTGLGTGRWFFQFRSTYDGINFNTWKNIAAGTSISEITVEAETNMVWAVFTLPGDETIGVGQGFGSDGDIIGLPSANLFTSAMFSLTAPNGFNTEPPQVTNILTSEIVLQEPTGGTAGASGILDFPALISMKYGDRNFPQSQYSGNANVMAIAFDPTGVNTTVYDSTDGISSWVVITLPGGAKIAFGSGNAADGTDIYVPGAAAPWIAAANMLSIPTIQGGAYTGHAMHGVNSCSITGLTMSATYSDIPSGSTVYPGTGNWMAVAWTPGLVTQTVTGGEFVVINLADGNKIAFGAGNVPSGSSFGLPAGFTSDQMAAIPSPSSYSGSGDNDMHVISLCDISGTTCRLIYIDGSGNNWSGNVNWFAFCWADAATVSPGAAGIVVSIIPNQVVVQPLATQQFTATVTGTGITTVTWSVDGIVGGNSTVGTISGAGLYTAPTTNGSHTVTAASTVNPARVGFAQLTIGSSVSGATNVTVPPTAPSYIGALAFDTTTSTLYVYTASGWVVA
jgi:hypothetical protein